MKKVNLLKIISVAGLLAYSSISLAQNAVIVNGTPIPSAKLDRLVESSGQEATPELRAKARDVLITKELISQEAAKRGLLKSLKYKTLLNKLDWGY